MKKMLLLLVCLTTFAWLHADEVTIDFSQQGYTNEQEVTSVKVGNDITINFSAGSKYYNSDTSLRTYSSKTTTVSSAAGNITNITFTYAGSKKFTKDAKVTTGSFSSDYSSWTGNAQSVTFTNPASQVRFKKMVITYTPAGSPTQVATPTFTPASGSAVVAGSTVTIACATEGATIYYTTDGTDPSASSTSTEYTAPIAIDKAMTIKAIAYMEGKTPSSVATATYTIMPSVANIAEFIELIKNNKDGLYSIQTPVTAVYQNGSNLYITDGKDWLLVYGNVEKKYENGDVIAKGIVGKPLNYSNGLYELSNPVASTFAAGVAGSPVGPIVVTEISLEDVNKYVKVRNVNITGQGAYAQDANGNLFTIHDKFKIKPSDATGVNLIGFVGVSKGALQIYPTEITKGDEGFVAAPTFNPAAGEVEAGTKVTISCATEGAEIEYVLNGGSDYIKYTEPIEITEKTTIEAYATKDGLEMSDIATAVYTIKKPVVATPTFDPAPGAVAKGTEVTITCATEGATLMYQVNGGDIQVGESPVIVVINEETTIEVVASKAGYEDSHASATYRIKGEAPVAPTALFDFTDPSKFGLTGTEDVLDKPFTINGITVEFTQAQGGNKPTYYSSTNGYHIRVYKNATIVVSASEGQSIESIQFKGNNLFRIMYNDKAIAESGQTTVNWWSPALDNSTITPLTTVVFNINDSGRAEIKSINVNDPQVTGVEDVTVDENAPVEYYNLQGVRVDNPENGIYIRRQGSKVSKVLVR